MTMNPWAKPLAPRHQLVLISQTLDDAISPEHPIRLFDGVLLKIDWKPWEAKYNGRRGQPPIHPRLMAGAILWGLMRRIRSSRDLEEATRERLDFRWFLEGRAIDHSTFALFRTEHEAQLKELSKQIARELVMSAAGKEIVEMVIDGTRLRANSDRGGARDAQHLEKMIAACSQALEEKLREMALHDEQSKQIEALRQRVEQLEAQRDKQEKALEEARRRDEVKREHWGKGAKAVRVPVTDPDSTILPNKEGGFAPNYTAIAAVEAASGAIVSAQIVPGNEEGSSVAKAMEDFSEITGQGPERVLGDSGFASGANLEKIEQKQAAAYMPVACLKDNPALREDPTKAVAEQLVEKLPRTGKYLSQDAFVYERERDIYHCPMGKPLAYAKRGTTRRTGIPYRAYRCPGKQGCPLAGACVKGKAKARLLARDIYQNARDRAASRMASEEGRAIYARRAPVAEGVFGIVKQAMGIRQFLLRGMRKVAMEWTWITSAYNLKKLLAALTRGNAANPTGGKNAKREGAGTGLHGAQRFQVVYIPFSDASAGEKRFPGLPLAA